MDVALQKVRVIRALAPKAITGDISNMLTQVVNASGGNVRKTILFLFPMLVDKILEFVDFWAVKVNNASTISQKEEAKPKASPVPGSFQIVQSEWQDYDDVERERLIPILQAELKSLREMYQERCDEVNSFEDRLAENNAQMQQEQDNLRKQLAALQDELDKERRKQVESLDASGSADTQEMAAQLEQIQQYQQDIQSLHQEMKHMLREKDLLIQSSTQLEEELHSTIMAKEKLTNLVADLKQRTEQIPQLETLIAMTTQQKVQAETQMKKLEAQCKNEEMIKEALAKKFQKKEKEYGRLVAQLENVTQQLSRTEENLSQLSNEHVALESASHALRRDLEELRECKEMLTATNSEHQKKIAALENDMIMLRVDKQNAEDDLLVMTNEKDMLLMALETSQKKLKEKYEELEAIESQKKTHLQQFHGNLVGGVGNIVEYFETRTAGNVSPVPGASSGNHGSSSAYQGGTANAANANNNKFPLLKRLSTGISSLAQAAQQQTGAQSTHSSDTSSSYGGEDMHQPYPQRGSFGGSGGPSSSAVAAAIRSKYSSSSSSGLQQPQPSSPLQLQQPAYATAGRSMMMNDDADREEAEGEEEYYEPLQATGDVDSDDDTPPPAHR